MKPNNVFVSMDITPMDVMEMMSVKGGSSDKVQIDCTNGRGVKIKCNTGAVSVDDRRVKLD